MKEIVEPGIDFLLLQLRLKGLWQRRSLGQHFLTDPALLERIARAANADSKTLVIEIGAGAGTLTTYLAASAGAVESVDLDQRLKPIHADAFGTHPQVKFHYGDALKLDLHAIAREGMARGGFTRAVLAGNLPFQITSPLLFGQCGPGVPWAGMAVMVQREVADRITARPDCRDYGILTVKLGLWWRVTERFEVKADKFFPRPKVDASVLVFEPVAAAERPSEAQWPGLSKFIDAAFGQRRKMLVNSLAGRWPQFPGKPAATAALERLGLSPMIRAEDLSIAQLVQYYELLRSA